MLQLMVKALTEHPKPRILFLANGSTYSGDALITACSRLGIQRNHAQPRDPQARGEMERFWRTPRDGCLDHMGSLGLPHDVQVRLLATRSNADRVGAIVARFSGRRRSGRSGTSSTETSPRRTSTDGRRAVGGMSKGVGAAALLMLTELLDDLVGS